MRTRVHRGGSLPRPGREPGSLAFTLFGQTRQQVLALFFSRPDDTYYLREVARRTGGALGAVQRELSVLVVAGILTRTPKGQQVDYQANRQCPVFEELRSIVTKTTGLVAPLRGALLALADRIEVAFVFGSMASTGGNRDSDVDLFVIGRTTLSDVVDALAEIESLVGREVNAVVQSRAEFVRRVTANDHFASRVMRESKLFVIGGDDVLGGLAAERVARGTHDESPGDRRPARPGATRFTRQPVARRQR